MALEKQIQQMRDANFQAFASEQEKRTKAIMDSLSKYEQSMSKDNAAYMDAIKDVVEKTGDKSSSQLKDSLGQLEQLGSLISTQQDLSKADKAELQKAISIANDQINSAKSRDGLLNKIGETISNNAIDITSVVGGLSANSPALMFATKYVLDKRKQSKEEKKERKKAAAEEQLARLEQLSAAKSQKKVAENAERAMSGGGGAVGASGVEVEGASGGSELIVWNEIQAEELEKIRMILERTYQTNEDWRSEQEADSRNDEEARRDAARYDAAVLAALQEQSSISAAQMADLQKAMENAGGGDEEGGIWNTIKSALGMGAGGALGGAASGVAGSAMGALGRAASVAGRFAPAAGVAVGGAMIGKDIYDIGAAAFDDDILTDAQGKDMGGVIGGALLGTIGAFVGGPLGAGIGMSLGNMVGGFIGDTVAPNYEAVMTESAQKIQASKEALRASINTLDQMYRDGMLSEADYTAQRSALESQAELVSQQEEEAQQVSALNELRKTRGQQYNDLQAAITQMEENGVEVSQAMYDNLEVLEEEYYTANQAFENASAELQAKVDPSWWQSLTATLGQTWETVSSAASAAFDSLSAGFLSAKDWLSTKYDEVSAAFGESVENIKGWASEKISDAAAAVDGAITDTLGAVGLDDEYEAVKDTVAQVATDAKEAVQQIGEDLTDGVDLSDGLDLSDVGALAGNAGGLALDAREAVLDAAGDAVMAAAEAVGLDDELEAVQEKAGELYDGAAEAVSGAAQAVDDAATAVYETVMENETVAAAVEGVQNASDVIVEKGSEALDSVGDALEDAGDAIGETLSGWGSSISNFFGFGGDDAEAERLQGLNRGEIDRMAGGRVSLGTTAPINPGDPDENTQLMLDALVERGITDPTAQANIMGMIEGESGMKNVAEGSYRNTSNERIREAMGRRASGFSDSQLTELKGDDRAFYDAMYPELGGYDYRGRGFIQLTGQDNYKRIGDAIGHDLLGNPDLMNDPEVAALAAAEFMAQSGSESGLQDMETVYGRVYGVKPSDMRPGASRDYRMQNLRQRAGYASGFAEQLATGQLAASGVTPMPGAVADVAYDVVPQDPVTGRVLTEGSAETEALTNQTGAGNSVAVNAPTQTTISNNNTVASSPMANPRRNPPPGQGVSAFGWLFGGT
jgi:predicted chitinase